MRFSKMVGDQRSRKYFKKDGGYTVEQKGIFSEGNVTNRLSGVITIYFSEVSEFILVVPTFGERVSTWE